MKLHNFAILYIGGAGGNFLLNLLGCELAYYNSTSNRFHSYTPVGQPRSHFSLDKQFDVTNQNVYQTHDHRVIMESPRDNIIYIRQPYEWTIYLNILQHIKLTITGQMEGVDMNKVINDSQLWHQLEREYIDQFPPHIKYDYEDIIVNQKVEGTIFEPYKEKIKQYHVDNLRVMEYNKLTDYIPY